ncbi:accessory Sec system glycosyltransferase Asp1 [Lactococcus nasutitermitis]|uniref:Accessory Sec system glycosyltransferase Asp1 n=1 Tax=Lactococcus nasutitermitis TaxID=1652957 RepID=A0ABV9JEM4_9LACT|nr:accessory Sec system glycosyltransferase Asp1 [Lactococcus nasutitermitis]
MNYFVNENIFTLNSGTEFSAIKRVKLFHDNNIPAKILVKNYNSQLSGDVQRAGLSYTDVINMYDYFQGIEDVVAKDIDVRYTEAIDKELYHIEGIDANESLIKHAGKVIGKVSIAPATVGIVGSIDYFNDMNGILAKDIWDRRGFKSSTQYFHPNGTLGSQIFFDYNGVPKLEITHMNINGQLNPTMYKLLDYEGCVWRFNTEQELFTFFLNELARKDEVVYINDRPSLVAALADVTGAVGKWQFLHNIHTANNLQVGASRKVVDYLEPLFSAYKDEFDGIIVATDQQRDEIKKFYSFKNVISLPDTFADEGVLKQEKRENKVIYLGRLAAEKNPIDVLEIVKRVQAVIPDLVVEFYGYASPADIQEQMNKKVEELDLKDNVKFKGYQSKEKIDKALDTSKALLNVSGGEGFGMNVLEALSHGVPVVAYGVKYGLSDMIENGRNGRLVPYGALNEAAQALADVLVSDLVEVSYQKSQEFSEEKAWERWLKQKNTIKNLFVGGVQ